MASPGDKPAVDPGGGGSSQASPSVGLHGTRLSAAQLAACAYLGGWAGTVSPTAPTHADTGPTSNDIDGAALVTPIAIALAESSGYCQAVSETASDGTRGYGVMQIESSHPQYGPFNSGGPWTDPITNFTDGHQLYQAAGGRYTPWSTYNSGAYLLHEAEAQAGVTALVGDSAAGGYDVAARRLVTDVPETNGAGLSDGIFGDISDVTKFYDSVTGFLGKLGKTSTWASVGYVVAGVAILGAVLFHMVKGTKVGGGMAKAAEMAVVA